MVMLAMRVGRSPYTERECVRPVPDTLATHLAGEGSAGVDSLVRVLNIVFWVAAPLFVASLFLPDFTAGLFGDRGSRVVNAVLITVVVVCSGAIASYEFGRNPIAETERGEWTNRQLFYALVFAISFLLAGLFIAVAVF
jgi:hypothetical protein